MYESERASAIVKLLVFYLDKILHTVHTVNCRNTAPILSLLVTLLDIDYSDTYTQNVYFLNIYK